MNTARTALTCSAIPIGKTTFSGDRSVVGRLVLLNEPPFTILGVAPGVPRHGDVLHAQLPGCPSSVAATRAAGATSTFAPLATSGCSAASNSGVTAAQANTELNAVGEYLAATYPARDQHISFSLTRPGLMGDTLGRPVHAFAGGIMSLALLILLAACANLGSLFAAPAADRSREVALQLSLGSSRRRILRQLMTEAMLISLTGGSLGLLATWIPALRAVSVHPAALLREE